MQDKNIKEETREILKEEAREIRKIEDNYFKIFEDLENEKKNRIKKIQLKYKKRLYFLNL